MKAIFKHIILKEDPKTGERRPRSAKRTIAYALREGTGADKDPVLAVEGRAPGGGAIFGDAKLDAVAFASRAPLGKSEVGHYFLAAEGEPSPQVTAKLLRACHAWAEKYLDDDRGYLLVAHRQHVHIIPEWYNSAGRAFYVDDDLYMRMKLLEFTREFEANPQTKDPTKQRRTFDPKAVNSRACSIAKRILDGKTSWEKLIREKEITPCKVKEGKVITFECTDANGRLLGIKVATVEAHIERERKRRAAAEVKAKANALAQNARVMMGRGLGDLIDQIDEIAQAEPVPQAPRGRSR